MSDLPELTDLGPMAIRRLLVQMTFHQLVRAYEAGLDTAYYLAVSSNSFAPLELFLEKWRNVLAHYYEEYEKRVENIRVSNEQGRECQNT